MKNIYLCEGRCKVYNVLQDVKNNHKQNCLVSPLSTHIFVHMVCMNTPTVYKYMKLCMYIHYITHTYMHTHLHVYAFSSVCLRVCVYFKPIWNSVTSFVPGAIKISLRCFTESRILTCHPYSGVIYQHYKYRNHILCLNMQYVWLHCMSCYICCHVFHNTWNWLHLLDIFLSFILKCSD